MNMSPFSVQFLHTLKKHGVTDSDLQFVTESSQFGKLLARYIRSGLIPEYWDRIQQVRDLLSIRIWDAGTWRAYFGETLCSDDRTRLVSPPPFPWSREDLLEECPFSSGEAVKDTHFGFLGMPTLQGTPLSIRTILGLAGADKEPMVLREEGQFLDEPHDHRTLQLRWYLMPTVPVYANLPPQEQIDTLPARYEVAELVEEIGASYLAHLKQAPWRHPHAWVRTYTDRLVRNIVDVGYHPSGRVRLSSDTACSRCKGSIGLSVSRKYPQ